MPSTTASAASPTLPALLSALEAEGAAIQFHSHLQHLPSRKLCIISVLLLLLLTAYSVLPEGLVYGGGVALKEVPMYDAVRTSVTPRTTSIGINPSSTIAADVLGIWHDPQQASIIVTTNITGRCPDPVLRGRLSGPALTIIEWERKDRTTLVGKYHVPKLGTYFVEIIVLLCHEWKEETDFRAICLEEPSQHRVSQFNASITATRLGNWNSSHDTDTDLPSHFLDSPYWLSTQNNASSSYKPLYTRFQPHNCRGAEDLSSDRCTGPTDLGRFDSYSYDLKWQEDDLRVKVREEASRENGTKLCLIGWSHSRVLMWAFRIHVVPGIAWGEAKYPGDVTRFFVQNLMNTTGCNKLVIGLGQWPASGERPMLFREYEKEIGGMLHSIADIPGLVSIFLRSIHYNPIGDKIGKCPPSDWRSPPVIDGYNKIITRISGDFDFVEYIDTNSIIGPMWDSPSDWCHFKNAAGRKEALYIAAKVFGIQ
jgi:hypothetical protein